MGRSRSLRLEILLTATLDKLDNQSLISHDDTRPSLDLHRWTETQVCSDFLNVTAKQEYSDEVLASTST